jgi:hypothetical protein
MNLRREIEAALVAKRGLSETYTKSLEENLVDRTTANFVRKQLNQGSGSELAGAKPKIQSVGSSSALVANTFVPWIPWLNRLRVGGMVGFQEIQLEKKMSSGLGGVPPNLDVFLGHDSSPVFLEAKFLEPLSEKVPSFSESYQRIDDVRTKSAWYQLFEKLTGGDSNYRHLDVAQLVKHFFGITNPANGIQNPTLIYLYWEPGNAEEFEEFTKHRFEVNRLEEFVGDDAQLQFRSMTYRDLWLEWEKVGDWESEHVQRLRSWYDLSIYHNQHD